MATITELLIRLGVDTKSVKPDAEKAAPIAEDAGRKAGKRFTAGFKSTLSALKTIAVTAVAAVSIGTIAHGIMDVTAAASDLNETTSKTQVLFGKSTQSVLDWSSTSTTALGQTQQQALDAASTFAVYGKQARMSGKDLVGFSTNMTSLASDMASFSNTSPEEAIQALGSAFKGESDPIERYGVLLNEATIKARALKIGIIKTSSEALSPQQRILAVQAELYEQLGKKGSGALGDFARTSGGLANQQRILTASIHDQKAAIGSALLPVMTSLVSSLNTQLMPAVSRLWSQHGPKVTAWLTGLADKIGQVDWAGLFDKGAAAVGRLVERLKGIDWEKTFNQGRDALVQLAPLLGELASQSDALAPTISVAGTVMGFLADHTDELGKAMPFLLAGLAAFKVAQTVANVLAAASPIFKIADTVASRQLAASINSLTAAQRANAIASGTSTAATTAETTATNVGFFARTRAAAAAVAMRTATIAGAAASGIATAAQWLWNTSLYGCPLVWIIAGIVALVAIIILVVKHWDFFKKYALIAMNAVWSAIKFAWSWIKKNWPLLLAIITGPIGLAVLMIVKHWDKIKQGAAAVKDFIVGRFQAFLGFVGGLKDKITGIAKNMFNGITESWRRAINGIIALWNNLSFTIPSVSILGKQVFDGYTVNFPDIPYLAGGGYVPARSGGQMAVIAEGGDDEIVAPEPMMRRMIEKAVEAGRALAGGRGQRGGHEINVNVSALPGVPSDRQIANAVDRVLVMYGWG